MALYEKKEFFDEEVIIKMASNYRSMLESVGENPEREGLQKTPERAAKALATLTSGMGVDAPAILKGALFTEPSNEMVLVRDIEVYSLCEHHLLPFFGKAHVAYIPDGKIVGLSKIPRVVDAFSRRLQVQERLTEQVRDCIQNTLGAKGVAVVIEARHLCMQMRGVEKQNTITTTSAFTGLFLNDPKTRREFMQLAIGSSYGRS
tara:strand:- start:116 stop:727 length:612 start_codon:yes stop_codon:yes gene_type:complete